MTIWTSYLYPAIGLTRLIKRHKNRLPFRFIPIVFENPAYRFPEELHIYSIASMIVISRPRRGHTLSKLYLGSHNPQFATALTGNVVTGTPNPLTLLHLGGEGASGAGWRDWMDIGTYYASREGFDNMYVGLRRIAADRNEAIINFGNNPSGNSGNDDLLRFVFTVVPGNGSV